MKAFGLDNAKKLLKHWPYVYCPTLGVLLLKNANPKVGDIVIFKHGGTLSHTGFVTKVAGDRFWTIEGNTSGASGIVANGGGVCQKSYYNSNLPGTKFCTPDYSIVLSADKDETDRRTNPEGGSYMFNPETVKAGDKNTSVLLLQEILRARGFKGEKRQSPETYMDSRCKHDLRSESLSGIQKRSSGYCSHTTIPRGVLA